MRLPVRHALLSLVLTAGVLGSVAPAAGAQTTPTAPATVEQGATEPATAAGQEAAHATPAGQVAAATVPGGKLRLYEGKAQRGLPLPATPPSSTLTVPAKITAPVYGAATISGSLSYPHAGVTVIAEQQIGGVWTRIGSATTGTDGTFRISTSGGDARLGTYSVRVSTPDARISSGTTPTVAVTRAFTDPHQKLSDSQVRTLFRNHGLTWWSSGGCTNRNRSNCTSFDQMRASTVTETINLKQKSGCALLVTGGTETGHAAGTYSHWNGYKIDLQMSSCISSWVYRNGPSIGGSKWRVGTSIYYNERNHWDVQTRPAF